MAGSERQSGPPFTFRSWAAAALGAVLFALTLAAAKPGWAGGVQFVEPKANPSLLPGLGGSDRRERVDPATAPWRMLGRIQTIYGGRCTGFLIGLYRAMTAAHCLYRGPAHVLISPRYVHFLLAPDQGEVKAAALVEDYVIPPAYDPGRETESSGSDWAVLVLNEPLGAIGGVLPIARDPIRPSTPIVLGGYSRDHTEVIEADLHCKVLETVRNARGAPLLHHDCEATEGTSGAPLLRRSEDGWAVIGIQIGAVVNRAGGVAVPAFTLPSLEGEGSPDRPR
jgi:protease YdgD